MPLLGNLLRKNVNKPERDDSRYGDHDQNHDRQHVRHRIERRAGKKTCPSCAWSPCVREQRTDPQYRAHRAAREPPPSTHLTPEQPGSRAHYFTNSRICASVKNRSDLAGPNSMVHLLSSSTQSADCAAPACTACIIIASLMGWLPATQW